MCGIGQLYASDPLDPSAADLWLHRVFLIEAQPPLPRLATAPQLSPSIHVRLSGCPFVPLADFPALASNGIKARAASSDPVATFS
jgi:hypothetical protein